MANHAKAWGAKLLAYVLPQQNTVAGLPGVYVLSYSFGKELYSFPEDYTMVKYLITATLLAILSLTPWSFAQTADGETPAVEWSCDEDTGALRGLCVAYCEAMDCHQEDTHASYEACWQVKDNYEFHSGGAKPPCEPEHYYEDEGSDDTVDPG